MTLWGMSLLWSDQMRLDFYSYKEMLWKDL